MLIIKYLYNAEKNRKLEDKNKAYRWVITVPELLVILTGHRLIHELGF